MAVWLSMSMSYVGPGGSTNTSRVAVSVNVHWDSVSYNGNSPPVSVTIDGVTDTVNVSFNTGETGSGSQNIYSKYWDIAHDSSGSARTVYASASYVTGTASGTISASTSLPLAAIGGSSSDGDSGDTSGGDSGGDSGGTSGQYLTPHPDTNCAYLGMSDDGYNFGDIDRFYGKGNMGYVKFKTPSDLISCNKLTYKFDEFGIYTDSSYSSIFVSLNAGRTIGDYDSRDQLAWDIITTNTLTPNIDYKLTRELWNGANPPALEPDTEYIIAFSNGASDTALYALGPPAIIIDYTARGGVHIKTNGVVHKYFSYIKSGDNYDLYEPYIKNGSNWDIYGNAPAF